ncbi:hypothetical protein NESM_000648200 [Novymonas esmeraldas]|uniref:Uncharacterized protein n=1 Tax=Novymonas esmeraldas TaxID=1808958 RepID=A0AAW0EWA2_9TRYP
MPWWGSRGSGGAGADAQAAEVEAAKEALAAVFAPTNRPIASTSRAAVDGTTPPSLHGVGSERESASGSGSGSSSSSATAASSWWSRVRVWPPSQTATESSAADVVAPDTPFSSPPTPAPSVPVLSWQSLPACPLAGYQLTSQGLVDTLARPSVLLSAQQLRGVIRELTVVEQRSKCDVDRQFASHIGSRSLHGVGLLVSPVLFLTSIYLMTWKTARLYRDALPQDSVVFTRLLALLRLRMPAAERERVAQRHQRLMRATNARIFASSCGGAALFALAWVSRPPRDVLEEAPDVQTAKELIAYQRHSEASLKWCWWVYYHHPAYAAAASAGGEGGD